MFRLGTCVCVSGRAAYFDYVQLLILNVLCVANETSPFHYEREKNYDFFPAFKSQCA